MSAYFTTHHFSPRWTTPRHSSEEEKPHPPPVMTTITAPSLVPPEATPASPASKPENTGRRLSIDTLARLLHEFHLHTTVNPDSSAISHEAFARPHFDLLEDQLTYSIFGELAGLSRKDVTVEVNDQLCTVTISGHLRRLAPALAPEEGKAVDEVGVVHEGKAAAAEEGKGKQPEEAKEEEKPDMHWHVTERRVGHFRRAFQFPAPAVDMSSVKASMSNGLLCVVVAKKTAEAEAKEEPPRKVEVA